MTFLKIIYNTTHKKQKDNILIISKLFFDIKLIVGEGMKKELSIKQIFDDFTNKTILNDLETQVLIGYIRNESIVKMAETLSVSTATVSRTIAELKEKYDNYKTLELAKLLLLQ